MRRITLSASASIGSVDEPIPRNLVDDSYYLILLVETIVFIRSLFGLRRQLSLQ